MSSTTTAPGSPRWSDHRSERAGRYVDRTGLRKNIARAHDLSPQRISQVAGGDHTGTPQRWFEWLEEEARARNVDPWPWVTATIGVLVEIEAEQTVDVWSELRQTMDEEATKQAGEDVSWHHFLLALHGDDEDEILTAARRFVRAAELEMDRQARAVGLTRVYLRRHGVLL